MASEIKGEIKSHDSDAPKTSKAKSLPKDGQVMVAILKDMGINEFEPRVVNQLLEFSYRYTTNILEDAKIVSTHAKKKTLDIDDVKLAVEMYTEQNLTVPPSREVLLDMARNKNSAPLPIPKPTCGLRLPPDRYCLTACNYRIKTKPKPRPPGYGAMKSGTNSYANSMSGLNASRMPGSGFMPGVNKPIIKMNTPQAVGMPQIQISPQVQQQQPVFKISVNPQTMQTVTQPVKRKASDML